jgi:glutathionylspermidine synthase
MNDLGISIRSPYLLDVEERPVRLLYKLYPWEWMIRDPFGKEIPGLQTHFLEPAWKMLWSSKAMLPLIHHLYPDHPNVAPASFDRPLTGSYVEKPVYSREGQNVSIHQSGSPISTGGDYGHFPKVYQEFYPTPSGERTPILGSWCVDGEFAGLMIRESSDLITSNTASFLPHIVGE